MLFIAYNLLWFAVNCNNNRAGFYIFDRDYCCIALMFVDFVEVLLATAFNLIMTRKQDPLQFLQGIPVWLLLGLKGLFQCGQRALSSGHTLLRGLGCSPSDHAPVASVPWHLSEARHAIVQLKSFIQFQRSRGPAMTIGPVD